MNRDLTRGPVMKTMLLFAVPMILGDLLQQCYNVADTLIVGRFLGADALAAVGSAFTLMTFLTSILLGLSLGSGAVFSICFGQRDMGRLREGIRASFALLAAVTAILCALVYGFSEQILDFMRVTGTVRALMREYLLVIFAGLPAIFLYNYYAALLRSVGDSASPLIFLAVSAVMNIGLDLWFVAGLERGVAGAAEATVISQYVSGVGILLYARKKRPDLRAKGARVRLSRMKEIASFSSLTCIQQSIMNLGILMVQGLVNSFGTTVMAAFAAAVKIDAFAYLPVQDFGNAVSTFIAQNYGAGDEERMRAGLRGAVKVSVGFSLLVLGAHLALWRESDGPVYRRRRGKRDGDRRRGRALSAHRGHVLLRHRLPVPLLRPLPGHGPAGHVRGADGNLAGRARGAGLRAFRHPALGVVGIWWSVPIGWFLADAAGLFYYPLPQKAALRPAGAV